MTLGAGLGRLSDVADHPDKPAVSDSQLSEADRADLAYARERRIEREHRAWLWAVTKGAAKWAAVVAGGVLVLLNTVKAIIGAIRDGL